MKARRDEAEQEYLARHQEAVASTQRYLDDANAQLADAIRRAADKRLEADAVEMTIEVDGRKRREAAETEASQLVSDARERAQAIVTEAEQRSAQLVRDAEERLAELREERDAIAQYFESLRGALSSAEPVDVDS
jgi:hypothetical protein